MPCLVTTQQSMQMQFPFSFPLYAKHVNPIGMQLDDNRRRREEDAFNVGKQLLLDIQQCLDQE